MHWPLREVLAALGCAPSATVDGNAVVLRFSTDSRDLQPGDLFVALAGARHDGHDHVAASLQAGAVAALVERPVSGADGEVVVPSTEQALMTLAIAWRRRIAPQVIAITGSNGKTTVKDMVVCILRADADARGVPPDQEVLGTLGNFNNHLGLPLTLLRLRAGHRRAVLELGMNHAGELTRLSQAAQPQVALVNNVQRAHVGHFADMKAVAAAKGEIFAGLLPGGIAVINADDPSAGQLTALAGTHRVSTFACSQQATVGPLLADLPFGAGQQLVIEVAGKRHACLLPVPGRHNAFNALAAISATLALGVSVDVACAALEKFSPPASRLQLRAGQQGAQVIDDTYNANPDSVLAAIAELAGRTGTRVLVLGDLGELGDGAAAMHAELGAACRAAGIEHLFGLGGLAQAAVAGFGEGAQATLEPDQLLAWLQPLLGPQTTVLVKGSRFMRMERIVQGLT